MPKILEKDIVDVLYQNLHMFTNDIHPFRREYTMTELYPAYRCDMLGYRWIGKFRKPVAMEVKFNGNDRDLLLEVEKALLVRETRHKKYGLDIAVFIDKPCDVSVANYLFANDVQVFKYRVIDTNPLMLQVREVSTAEDLMHMHTVLEK